MSDKAAPCPLDHVNRQFHAQRRTSQQMSDFHYALRRDLDHFVYAVAACRRHLCPRRIVGWRVSRTAPLAASSWTLWNRLSMIGGLTCREAGSCTTAE